MKKTLISLALICASSLSAQEVATSTTTETIQATQIATDSVSTDSVTTVVESVATTAINIAPEASTNNGFLSHLSVGIKASTMGGGIQVATPIINNFLTLRAGFDYFSLKPGSWDISLNDDDDVLREAFGVTPDYKTDGHIQFVNGSALVDFYPTKGIFHLTAGVFVGTNKIKAKGMLVDPNTGEQVQLLDGQQWPELDFDGHRLDITDAKLDAELQLGSVIKPYFGMGLGRAIAKNNRVSFKFELGMLYQGDFSIRQNGKKLPTINDATESFEDIDDYKKWLKWWPMLSFQLSYRIF